MERLKLTVKGVWLIASLSSVILPIFLPTLRDGNLFGNAMNVAFVSMFLLSLPSSLLALPIASVLMFFLGIHPSSLFGLYINVVTLFALGLVQWFWIVPKVFTTQPMLQQLGLAESGSSRVLNEASAGIPAEWSFAGEITPLELALKDE